MRQAERQQAGSWLAGDNTPPATPPSPRSPLTPPEGGAPHRCRPGAPGTTTSISASPLPLAAAPFQAAPAIGTPAAAKWAWRPPPAVPLPLPGVLCPSWSLPLSASALAAASLCAASSSRRSLICCWRRRLRRSMKKPRAAATATAAATPPAMPATMPVLLLFWLLLGAAAAVELLPLLGGGGVRVGAAVPGGVSMAAGNEGRDAITAGLLVYCSAAWHTAPHHPHSRALLQRACGESTHPSQRLPTCCCYNICSPPGCSWWMLSTPTTVSGAGLGGCSGMKGVTSSGPWQQYTAIRLQAGRGRAGGKVEGEQAKIIRVAQ